MLCMIREELSYRLHALRAERDRLERRYHYLKVKVKESMRLHPNKEKEMKRRGMWRKEMFRLKKQIKELRKEIKELEREWLKIYKEEAG